MLNRQILCIINIGPSRFFLHQTAQNIARYGIAVETISGLVPNSKSLPSKLIQLFLPSENRLNGRVNGLNDLIPKHESIFGEISWQLGTYLGRNKIFNRLSKYFYAMSLMFFDLKAIHILRRKKDVSNLIYHVRSGCGNKSIAYAKNIGAKVVVDHSFPHPLYDFMSDQRLEDEFLGRFTIEMKMLNDLTASDNIVVNSEFVIDTFKKIGDFRNLKVLLPPIDEKFSQMLREATNMDRQGLIYFGTANLRKGIDKFLDVIDLLPTSIPVKIVGHWDANVDQIRNSLSEKSNVQILPSGDFYEIKEYLSSARYFLFLTRGEGSARTVAEAMHAGVIVLTTRAAGMIMDSNSLVDVSIFSPNEIVECIKVLEDKADLRETMSINAVELIAQLEKDYTPNLIKFYNSI